MNKKTISIDPIEELLVAGYLVSPTGRFRTMDQLRAWAKDEAKALRRAITKPR
jgi:hypothetical protein